MGPPRRVGIAGERLAARAGRVFMAGLVEYLWIVTHLGCDAPRRLSSSKRGRQFSFSSVGALDPGWRAAINSASGCDFLEIRVVRLTISCRFADSLRGRARGCPRHAAWRAHCDRPGGSALRVRWPTHITMPPHFSRRFCPFSGSSWRQIRSLGIILRWTVQQARTPCRQLCNDRHGALSLGASRAGAVFGSIHLENQQYRPDVCNG